MDTGEDGTVISPNYPNYYPNNIDETYSIEVETGFRIEISFLDFDLESASNCQYDYCKGEIIYLGKYIAKLKAKDHQAFLLSMKARLIGQLTAWLTPFLLLCSL